MKAELEEKIARLETLHVCLTPFKIPSECSCAFFNLFFYEQKILLEKVGRLELEIWKSSPRFETTSSGVVDDRSDAKNAILRTCLEIRETDPSLDSGMYWIDPDGQGVGDGAIYVFCDMTSGKTP